MVRNPDDLVAYDVRCDYCDHDGTDVGGPNTRVLWLPGDHDSGETIKHVHTGYGGCGMYGPQTIRATLPSLTHSDADDSRAV